MVEIALISAGSSQANVYLVGETDTCYIIRQKESVSINRYVSVN